jgi:cytosine/adenosine deaminase-related metal-dependent hydrolase
MRIAARHLLDIDGPRAASAITIKDGAITAVMPEPGPCDDVVAMPALVNAHDHARPVRSSSVGGFGKPLETWLHRLALLPPVDARLAATCAFARAALGGQGAAMVHYTRPMGLVAMADEARQVAHAAADVGIRIAFGIGMRDRNPLVYGDAGPVLDDLPGGARAEVERTFLAPMLPIAEQMARVDAVADRVASPMVDVQYAPNGPQWGSDALWEAIADASARTGRRVTTHLFETKYQRAWADQHYPQGLVRRWKEIGLLSPRLTLAHCVWARPDELDMIAEAGCVIATNTSSNLALRSGLAPVTEMRRRGCRVAMGIDGQAFDEDDDALREIRLLWSMHGGWGFDTEATPADVLRMALSTGRIALNAPGDGRLLPGAPADLVVIDRAALDEDAIAPVAPMDLLFARASKRHIREVIVAGRTIVRDGRVLGADLDAAHAELRGFYRAAVPSRAGLAAALPALDTAIAAFYRDRLGCC